MAETAITSLKDARERIRELSANLAASRAARRQKSEAETRLEREKEAAIKKAMEDAQKVARANEREIRALMKGPDYVQMGADGGALVVGETIYRLLHFGLAKLGAKHWAWYTLPPSGGGSLMYVLCYPRKEEGMLRKTVRALGLQWLIVGAHDTVGYILNSGAESKAVAGRLAAENAQLKEMLAAQAQGRQGG
jgi:hypothetical protein